MYIVNKENKNIEQIKQSVANELKNLSLLKKDRNFLILLIELFDWLNEEENERFLPKIQKLILEKKIENDQELEIRLQSLQVQLDANKNIKIVHLPTFSMYFQQEKIEIYLKKLPMSWDSLIKEIRKINFDYIQINVYKAITKKERILSIKLKSKELWEEKLTEILDKNIFVNTRITLFYKKKEI